MVFEPTMIIAGASLVGLTIVASGLLRAWQGWLALKRQELERHYAPDVEKAGSSLGAARGAKLRIARTDSLRNLFRKLRVVPRKCHLRA